MLDLVLTPEVYRVLGIQRKEASSTDSYVSIGITEAGNEEREVHAEPEAKGLMDYSLYWEHRSHCLKRDRRNYKIWRLCQDNICGTIGVPIDVAGSRQMRTE